MEAQLENSFLQIPFEAVVEQVDGGNVVLRGLISMLQERLDLADREVEFSARAIRECHHEKEIKQCSMERALGYFKNYHLYNSKDQALLRKSIDDEVLLPLSIQSSKRAAEIAAQHKHLHHEEQRYATAMESLQKAKLKHEKLVEQIKCLHAKLTKRYRVDELAEMDKKKGYFHGFFGSLDPEQERDKQKKKLEKLKHEYESSHHELMQKKNIVLESMISLDRAEDNATDVYERLERCRLDKISSSMKKFCSLERHYLESRLQHLDQFESGAVARLAPAEDANLFVQANKKPSDALRRSYAVHILHLNHLSRALPDDSFTVCDSECGEDLDPVDPTSSDVDIVESVEEEQCPDDGDVKLNPGPDADPEPKATPSQESSPVETSPRSRSATASSAPRPSTPEMCIQERIARRNLDAIFGASTEEGSGDDHALSMSSHGGDDSSVASSPAPPNTKSKTSKSKSRRKSARLKGSLSEDSLVFSEEHSAAYLAVHPEEWRVLFADADGRKYFLQMLDEKRGCSATLHPRGFRALTTAMQVFLDECEYVKDRTSAMRMANMGNTFHSYSVVSDVEFSPASTSCSLVPPPSDLSLLSSPSQKDDRSSDVSQPVVSPVSSLAPPPMASPDLTGTSARKMYLQREKVIRDHSIWKSHRFWEDALQHGVIGQLKLTEAVVWDELSPEELHESITAVQNIIFGQLGAMAFTMHEIGIQQNEVEQMISDLCRASQLTFDHRKELMRSTSETFKHRHEEEDVPIDAINFSPSAISKTVGGGPSHVGDRKDAVFESETKETLDDIWWKEGAY